jgi:hypothetical protein
VEVVVVKADGVAEGVVEVVVVVVVVVVIVPKCAGPFGPGSDAGDAVVDSCAGVSAPGRFIESLRGADVVC